MIEQIRSFIFEAFQQGSGMLYFLMFAGGLFAALTPKAGLYTGERTCLAIKPNS